MIRRPHPPDALREKLSPPRALEQVGGALYGRPLPGSSLAWLAWLPADLEGAIEAVMARAITDGATSLAVGGPPGNYLASGVDPRDEELCKLLEFKGFFERSRHVELCVSTAGHVGDPGVVRVGDEGLAWVASTFSAPWSMEAQRALSHGGLFALRGLDGALAGFACHSGNRAWDGVFGPIGVAAPARGAGFGRRLATTVFADMASRGFESATVPWVDAETARFYESWCDVRSRVWRVEYRAELGRGQ